MICLRYSPAKWQNALEPGLLISTQVSSISFPHTKTWISTGQGSGSRVQGGRLGMNAEKETEERKKTVEIISHIYVWGMDICF